jgi:membrane protein implicated in regulation of membrane protease activity
MQTEAITVAIDQSIKWATLFQWGGFLFLGIVVALIVWSRRKKDLAEQQITRSFEDRKVTAEKPSEKTK